VGEESEIMLNSRVKCARYSLQASSMNWKGGREDLNIIAVREQPGTKKEPHQRRDKTSEKKKRGGDNSSNGLDLWGRRRRSREVPRGGKKESGKYKKAGERVATKRPSVRRGG